MALSISLKTGVQRGSTGGAAPAIPANAVVNRDGAYVVNRDGAYLIADPAERTS